MVEKNMANMPILNPNDHTNYAPFIVIGIVLLLIVLIGGIMIWSQGSKITDISDSLNNLKLKIDQMSVEDEVSPEMDEVIETEAEKTKTEDVDNEHETSGKVSNLPEFISSAFGYSFEFSTDYVVKLVPQAVDNTVLEMVYVQSKTQIEQFNKLAEEGLNGMGGGPVITFTVLANPDMLDYEAFAKKNVNYTNYEDTFLAEGPIMTTIDNYKFFSYKAIGMGEFDYLILKIDETHMLVMKVFYNDKNDPIKNDFKNLVSTLRLK